MKYPPYFDSEDTYTSWRELAALDPSLALFVFAHCVDCTPKYSSIMKSLGRCENESVNFYETVNEDDELELIGFG